MQTSLRKAAALLVALNAFLLSAPAVAQQHVTFGVARLPNGISLHYAEEGHGDPVIFVPGSLADYSYWADQANAFSHRYRAIAYSRRYDYPNANPRRAGYSAVTDADDLALLIKHFGLKNANIVGHSYGALTALILAIRHPELVKSVVLAEPPAVTLLQNLPGPLHSLAAAQYGDIQRRLVAPMRRAFERGNTDEGIGTFMAYVFNNRQAWRRMSRDDRAVELRSAEEWRVMMTSGTLFPFVDPRSVRRLRVPVMLIGGTSTYPFLITIMSRLCSLLPHSVMLWVPGAGHQMWYQAPELCRRAVEQFIDNHRANALQ
jgi:pimeloyl-ACP methyl ester carboxylesterase